MPERSRCFLGTCVNVGCIPKKLFHQAGLLGESMADAPYFGWTLTSKDDSGGSPKPHAIVQHRWSTLVNNVQSYIKSLNFGYRSRLRTDGVEYINGRAEITSPN